MTELLASLRRAGLEFHDEVGLDEDGEKGTFEVTVRLRGPVPPAGVRPLSSYVRGLAEERGLDAAVHLRRRRGQLAILFSKALSRAS